MQYYSFCWHSFLFYDKQLDQKQPGKERLSFILHFPVIIPPGRKLGQVLKARPEEETTVYRLVYTTQDHLTVGRTLPRASLIKQIPTDKQTGQCDGGKPSSEVPFSQFMITVHTFLVIGSQC